ncbi:hypothetical protein O181_113970, partial [Austropuccinia psidii MF-1]|nr:hypothetical protein [Austropuccinia psidii MF-1]
MLPHCPHPHASALLLLNMLTLPLHPQDTPSQHASNTGLILNAAYCPYAPAAPSICDSNATPHLHPHHLPSLCFRI